ncbi:MAG: hypothetical protein K0Q51_931 [Rickettsiaceae bacterium]|jgi:mannosyltransferase OCH1-like enzyme|nr:hypothetical protein [Rickettsiaceae bacterium]
MHQDSNSLMAIDWNKSFAKYFKKPKFQFFSRDKTKQILQNLKDHHNALLAKAHAEKPLIPQVIHQIAIDADSIPRHHLYYSEMLRAMHPGWKYKCWTLEQALKLCTPEQKETLKGLDNNIQIDFLKYVILREYGGVYIDYGIKCFKPLDILNYYAGLFIGLLPPSKCKNLEISSFIIGASANHPIINEVIEKIDFNLDNKDLTSVLSCIISLKLQENTLDDALILPPVFFGTIREASNLKETNYERPSLLGKNELMQPFSRVDKNSFACLIGHEKYSFIKAFNFTLQCGVGHVKESLYYSAHKDDSVIFDNFKKAYNKHHPSKVPFSDEAKIPHQLHLIDADQETYTKFENIYKGWRINNWSLSDLRLRLKNRGLSVIEDPFIEKFIVSLLIIFESGGVFIDNDYIPIKDITDFTYQYDFFAGLLPPGKKRLGVGYEIIGAIPRSPVIEQTLDYLFDNFDYLNFIDCNNVFAYMISKAGVYHKNIVFPPTFLYPIAKQRLNKSFLSKLISKVYGPEYIVDFTKPTPESHFIHKNYISEI